MVLKTNLPETGTCQKVRFSSRQGTPPPLPPRQRHTRSRYPQDNGTPNPHQNTLQATSGAPTVKNLYGWHTQPLPQAPAGHIACADVLRIAHQHPARPQKTPHSAKKGSLAAAFLFQRTLRGGIIFPRRLFLEQAVVMYALNILRKHGFTPFITPDVAKAEILHGKDVFSGKIYDNTGVIRCEESEIIRDEILLEQFDWFVEGVEIYEK